ncbi:hypothetical protein RB195_003706 [Necator americanus]|uniref:Uncharacterized protein n=1 Tax=Necator americanus TaxID=51031 RepID=A0ABR1DQJ1_NECAM
MKKNRNGTVMTSTRIVLLAEEAEQNSLNYSEVATRLCHSNEIYKDLATEITTTIMFKRLHIKLEAIRQCQFRYDVPPTYASQAPLHYYEEAVKVQVPLLLEDDEKQMDSFDAHLHSV